MSLNREVFRLELGFQDSSVSSHFPLMWYKPSTLSPPWKHHQTCHWCGSCAAAVRLPSSSSTHDNSLKSCSAIESELASRQPQLLLLESREGKKRKGGVCVCVCIHQLRGRTQWGPKTVWGQKRNVARTITLYKEKEKHKKKTNKKLSLHRKYENMIKWEELFNKMMR